MNLPDATRLKVFAVVAPGIEEIVAAELRVLLDGRQVDTVAGGAEFVCGRAELLGILASARTAEAMRVRVGRFDARTFAELEQGLRKVAWHAWIPRDASVEVFVSCAKSRLYHSDAVADRVRAALGERPSVVGTAGQRVYLRLDHDVVQVSIDASGELLHRRGWRTHVGAAPLRETLAAACVVAVDGHQAGFVDPFCGSGSLVGEAILLAKGQPASSPPWAATSWPAMRAIEAPVTSLLEARAVPSIIAGDFSEREVAATRHNLEAAGALEACDLRVGDFAETLERAPEAMMVLTNPPWGRRLESSRDLHALYRRFGAAVANRSGRVCVLSGWPAFESATRLRWNTVLRFPCRGIPVRLLEYQR